MTLLLFLLLIIASQLIGRRAISKLTAEEKVRAVDFGVGRGIWVLFAIALLYALDLAVFHFIGSSAWHLPVLSIALLIIILVGFAFEFTRLNKTGLPRSYIRSVGLTYLLLFIGLVAVLGKDVLHIVGR